MANKYQVNDHSVLTVTKDEAKTGKSWHDISRNRAFKQHGENHEDPSKYPEGDIHAPIKHDTSSHLPKINPEETNAAISSLEERLKQVQAQQQQQTPPPPPQPEKSQVDKEYEEWFRGERD